MPPPQTPCERPYCPVRIFQVIGPDTTDVRACGRRLRPLSGRMLTCCITAQEHLSPRMRLDPSCCLRSQREREHARRNARGIVLYPYTDPGSRLVAGWWKNTPAILMPEEEHGHRAGLSCCFDPYVAAIVRVGWTEPCDSNHGGRCRREPFVDQGVQRPGAAAHDSLLRIALPL